MIHLFTNHVLLISQDDDMGKHNQDYATMGLKALSRAAQKAIAEAKRKNLKIPVWKDGKIGYISPESNAERLGTVDCSAAAFLHRSAS